MIRFRAREINPLSIKAAMKYGHDYIQIENGPLIPVHFMKNFGGRYFYISNVIWP
jgi:hypothetical protein